MSRLFFAFGSGFALIAVITGAFAAHALKTTAIAGYVSSL